MSVVTELVEIASVILTATIVAKDRKMHAKRVIEIDNN
jgi:hypothetical protein